MVDILMFLKRAVQFSDYKLSYIYQEKQFQ